MQSDSYVPADRRPKPVTNHWFDSSRVVYERPTLCLVYNSA